MRVLHVACVSPPEIGGIGRVAADTVADLCRRGIEAELATLTTHGGMRFGNAGRIKDIGKLVTRADIVHLHYPFFGTAGMLARLRRRGKIRKLVVTLHMDASATGLKGKIFDVYRRLFQRRILDVSDLLISASKDYVRHSSFQPYEDRVLEIPFGIDADIFSPGVSTLRNELGIPAHAFVVGFVGGMDRAHAFKGVDILLKACAVVPECFVILVGDGELRRSYELQAAALGLSDRCRFLGKVDVERLVAAYRAMDMLAFPSISGAEAFGLVAIEAQACGTPVIASNLPGVRTVVADEESGILIEPKSVDELAIAIRRLIDDSDIRRRLGERARARVAERFTRAVYLDRLQEAYRKLL